MSFGSFPGVFSKEKGASANTEVVARANASARRRKKMGFIVPTLPTAFHAAKAEAVPQQASVRRAWTRRSELRIGRISLGRQILTRPFAEYAQSLRVFSFGDLEAHVRS